MTGVCTERKQEMPAMQKPAKNNQLYHMNTDKNITG